MLINLLKSKIHRATVVDIQLDYVGSITVDSELMEAAHIREYEQVQVVDINNGKRFNTYIISGERDTGIICLNGAAARQACVGDKIIIMTYCLSEGEKDNYKPRVVLVNDQNKIIKVCDYEKHGELNEENSEIEHMIDNF